MFSQTVEYALRAMAVIASDVDRAWRHRELAKITKVPPDYLSKVLQSLVRAGLVKSQRGVGGGFTLVGDPSRVIVLEIVNSVDPIQRIHTCPLGLKSHGTNLCPLHKKLDQALYEAEKAFSTTTLSDIVKNSPEQKSRACNFPLRALPMKVPSGA